MLPPAGAGEQAFGGRARRSPTHGSNVVSRGWSARRIALPRGAVRACYGGDVRRAVGSLPPSRQRPLALAATRRRTDRSRMPARPRRPGPRRPGSPSSALAARHPLGVRSTNERPTTRPVRSLVPTQGQDGAELRPLRRRGAARRCAPRRPWGAESGSQRDALRVARNDEPLGAKDLLLLHESERALHGHWAEATHSRLVGMVEEPQRDDVEAMTTATPPTIVACTVLRLGAVGEEQHVAEDGDGRDQKNSPDR